MKRTHAAVKSILFIRRVFFWICLDLIEMMERGFNCSDIFLTLSGFKNYKVMTFKTKLDLNKLPQNSLDWHKNDKIDKTLINFLEICE